ncbi:MAG: lysophospholipid acyltransferase family protein [Clostridia bacterium]
MLRRILMFLVDIVLCKIFHRAKYINREKEKNLKSCIICANHSAMLEPAYIYVTSPKVYIMAKAELFKNNFFASIFKYFGIFPINRGNKDAGSLLHSINIAKKEGTRLLIFPEGTRIIDGKKSVPKVGPAFIACKSGVPIVPVYITRSPKAFSKVSVIYGDPIYVPSEYENNKSKLYDISYDIMQEIYKLRDLDTTNNRKEEDKILNGKPPVEIVKRKSNEK